MIMLPTIMMAVSALVFLVLERIRPGRDLPHSRGWYFRALSINLIQLLITVAIGKIWNTVYGTESLLHLSVWNAPIVEGLTAWFAGTFVFYWWHRLRHFGKFWQIFHQVHHSPSRIEILTSFYKHPIEILVNSFLSGAILFPLLGCSLAAGVWYNFFAATGEFFYHGNYRSPRWLRFIIQTPELHSIHHQLNVHRYNFGDIPLWDRLFGTYRDSVVFVPRCGFPNNNEERLVEMLVFKDVYV